MQFTINRKSKQRGFTLIEIMVVVVILGILASYVALNVIDKPDEARVVAAKTGIRTMVSALKLYRLDNGRYPETEQGLQALVQKPDNGQIPRNWKSGGYLESSQVPKDPWQADYQYLKPGVHGEIDVFSYGGDNQPGGEGYDADIGNWDLD